MTTHLIPVKTMTPERVKEIVTPFKKGSIHTILYVCGAEYTFADGTRVFPANSRQVRFGISYKKMRSTRISHAIRNCSTKDQFETCQKIMEGLTPHQKSQLLPGIISMYEDKKKMSSAGLALDVRPEKAKLAHGTAYFADCPSIEKFSNGNIALRCYNAYAYDLKAKATKENKVIYYQFMPSTKTWKPVTDKALLAQCELKYPIMRSDFGRPVGGASESACTLSSFIISTNKIIAIDGMI